MAVVFVKNIIIFADWHGLSSELFLQIAIVICKFNPPGYN